MNWKFTIILGLLLFVGCKNVSTEREELAKAESFLENTPDSALLILDDKWNYSDTQALRLIVRYSFNTAMSKYKGK